MSTIKLWALALLALGTSACARPRTATADFIRTDGVNLVDSRGNRFEIGRASGRERV